MLLTDGRVATDPYDGFVVGSGPAGLSVALALAEANKRVLVFESGDAESVRSELANTIGYGHFSGSYWNAHWIRALGGTSAVWNGWCSTLRAVDFDSPVVGVRWPIRRADLSDYYARAAAVLDHDAALIDLETPVVPGFSYRPIPIAGPTRFGRKYVDTLRSAGNVDVAVGCSLVRLDANDRRSSVTVLEYVHHPSGVRRRLSVAPGQSVVIAAGGIGNAQLLQQPPAMGGVPVGNESGLAGMFLMEHPHLDRAGEVVLDERIERHWPAATGGVAHAVVAEDEVARREGLYGCSLQLADMTVDHELARHFSSETGRTFHHYTVTARSEMLPSAGNRVLLTGERDRSGLLRPAARCVCDARDLLNVEQTLRLLGAALLQSGKGRVRVNNDQIYRQFTGGGHTMGTTRMGNSASDSVVDGDCRVHGYTNLFVAGSSVFATGGHANPTLTIVALGLRLADTIAARDGEA